jgi:hypothetical protein
MEENDHRVGFIKTGRNELFGSLEKATTHGQQTRHICRYYIENDSIRQKYLAPLPELLGTYIDCLDEHRYILTVGSHKFILDMNDRSLTPFALDTHNVNYVTVDRDGAIWFSAEDGVYQCTKNFLEYRLGLSRNDDIWSVIRD